MGEYHRVDPLTVGGSLDRFGQSLAVALARVDEDVPVGSLDEVLAEVHMRAVLVGLTPGDPRDRVGQFGYGPHCHCTVRRSL